MRHARLLTASSCLVLLASTARTASSAPALRHQVDQIGDFALIGNTLAHDCGNGTPAPLVGTLGVCGSNVSDSSPDIFWRADEPAQGQAFAAVTVSASQARSTSVLALPSGAQITYARLYWAGLRSAPGADTSASLERPGVFSTPVNADVSHAIAVAADTQYESSSDVTALVQQHGNGAYRVSGVDAAELASLQHTQAFAAWSLVVFYELAGQPLRQLTLFDGLDVTNSGPGVGVSITGFLIPMTGIDAKLGVMAFLGDGQTAGDTLTFNGAELTDGLTSTNNFFNGSRTWLGAPVSSVGDLPQLTGGSRSMSGVDLDVVDVTSLVNPGSTSAAVQVKAGGDGNILLGGLITSVTTYKPNFNDSLKTASDLNGGALLVGDTLAYHVNVTNTGNDPALEVVLSDALPPGVSFVPGSIRIVTGANAGFKTDAAGDDQAEYVAATRTVVVRCGAGASASTGGSMAIGESSEITFRVSVDPSAIGSVLANQASISARGQNGAPTTLFKSDDGMGGSTTTPVDECGGPSDCPANKPACYEPADPKKPNVCVPCTSNAQCSGTTPVCQLSSHTCIPCASDAECLDAARPVCATAGAIAGACVECSGLNAALCTGSKPICLAAGVCGCTDVDGDSECGAAASGIVCSGPAGACVPGCSTAAGRNDCPVTQYCSKQDGSVGTCSQQPCVTDQDCSAPLGVCDTSSTPHVCVQCLADADCGGGLVCDQAGTRACVECTPDKTGNCLATGAGPVCLATLTCGCAADGDCGASDSGRICDDGQHKCASGCRGTGNGCPAGLVCTSGDATPGVCVVPDQCQSNADCAPPKPLCDLSVSPKQCVGCFTAADCAGVTPVCSAEKTCVGCSSDGDCTDPATPACNQSGALAGACTMCSASHVSLCGGAWPQCLFEFGVCGCSDVDGDAECGGPTSGVVCSGPKGSCVAGCSLAPGRNDCPADGYCSEQSGAVGTCLAQCVTDLDCASGVCDTGVHPHACVQCLQDLHCAAPLVCEPALKQCVVCTQSNVSACNMYGEGAACLPDNTCGCLADSDCGDSWSGRVCGLADVCIVGCRGTGGNGCPAGQHCSSPDSTIGVCEADVDAGADSGDDGAVDGGDDPDGSQDAADETGDAAEESDAPDGADANDSGADAKDSGADAKDSGADAKDSGADAKSDGADAKDALADAGGDARDGAKEAGAEDELQVEEAMLEGGGCGCTVPRSQDRGLSALALAALAGAVGVRRRRRRSP